MVWLYMGGKQYISAPKANLHSPFVLSASDVQIDFTGTEGVEGGGGAVIVQQMTN